MTSRIFATGHYAAGTIVGLYLGAGGHPTFRVAALVVALSATFGARRSVARASAPAGAATCGPVLASATETTDGHRDDDQLLLVS